MITLIYRILVLFILLLTLWNLFTEDKVEEQANAAIVVIPLVLRILMIK